MQDQDQFIQAAKRTPVDMKMWAVEMMEKNKRKSHLQPPLSPTTQALLRSDLGKSSGATSSATTPGGITPSSGDIPIAASSVSTPRSDFVRHEQASQSAGLNGGSRPSSRPGYPPRTSSTPGHAPTLSSTDTNGGMQIPFRPAPDSKQQQ